MQGSAYSTGSILPPLWHTARQHAPAEPTQFTRSHQCCRCNRSADIETAVNLCAIGAAPRDADATSLLFCIFQPFISKVTHTSHSSSTEHATGGGTTPSAPKSERSPS